MHFYFSDFTISPYLISFVLAFVITFTVSWILLRRKEIPRSFIVYNFVLSFVFALLCGKIHTMLLYGLLMDFLTAGFSSIGSAFGYVLGTIIFIFIYPEGKTPLFRVTVLTLPLIYSIAKFGCFTVGCCHGIPYDGPFCVMYENQIIHTGNVFPIQLIESIVFFIIFLICLGIYCSKASDYTFPVLVILCPAAKFIAEFFRGDYPESFLTVNQVLCILALCIGLGLFIIHRFQTAKNNSAKQNHK